MERDYSEYQPTTYDRYLQYRSNLNGVRLDYFVNKVYFHPERKNFTVSVDPHKENDSMQDEIDEYERDVARREGKSLSVSPSQDDPEDTQNHAELTADRREQFSEMQKRYQLVSSPFLEIDGITRNNLDAETINVLSGAYIRMNYGEGILDFVYADFVTPLRQNMMLLESLQYLAESEKEKSQSNTEDWPEPKTIQKIYNETQAIVEDFYAYESTFILLHDVAYASLYSAVCPPLFENGYWGDLKRLEWYGNYLLTLQNEYLEMLEFCYDEDFWPEVLGALYPSERLYLYRKSKGLPLYFDRKEEFLLNKSIMGGDKMPYGLKSEEFRQMLNRVVNPLSDAEKEFAKKYHIPGPKVSLRTNTFLSVGYEANTISDMLELEFTKMLEQGIRFRKCKRCGKYFIMKGNYDTTYCDRIAKGEIRTCQELAAIDNYKAKVADNEALAVYSKYYKRYSARLKVRQIKDEDFKKWRYQAIIKRDECTDGKITLQELIGWMEAAFPNRKPQRKEE